MQIRLEMRTTGIGGSSDGVVASTSRVRTESPALRPALPPPLATPPSRGAHAREHTSTRCRTPTAGRRPPAAARRRTSAASCTRLRPSPSSTTRRSSPTAGPGSSPAATAPRSPPRSSTTRRRRPTRPTRRAPPVRSHRELPATHPLPSFRLLAQPRRSHAIPRQPSHQPNPSLTPRHPTPPPNPAAGPPPPTVGYVAARMVLKNVTRWNPVQKRIAETAFALALSTNFLGPPLSPGVVTVAADRFTARRRTDIRGRAPIAPPPPPRVFVPPRRRRAQRAVR